jgi:outer membrane protein
MIETKGSTMRSLLLSWLLLVLGVGATYSQPPAPDTMSVDDAVRLVLSRNPGILEALHLVDARKARVNQSRSGYYPTVDAEASYTRLGPVPEIQFGGISFRLYPGDNYNADVALRQTLFDFNKTGESIALEESHVDLAEDALSSVKRDLSVRTAQTFYTLLFLRQSLLVQEDQIRTLSEHLLITEKKVDSGTATDLDVLTTQVRVAAAETQKISLESMLKKEEIAFRMLAALPPDSPVHVRGEFMQSGMALDADSLIAKAMENRVEIKLANHAVESAKRDVGVSRLSDAPSVGVYAAYGVKNGLMPNLEVLRGNFAASLQLQVPLFDGSKTSGKEEEAKANLLAAEQHKQQAILQIQSDILEALNEIRAAAERLEIAAVNIQQAERALETARLRYQAGTVTNLDLLDAETARSQARLTNVGALYDYVMSTILVKRAVGDPITGG